MHSRTCQLLEQGDFPTVRLRQRVDSVFGEVDWINNSKLPSDKKSPKHPVKRATLEKKFLRLMQEVHSLGIQDEATFHYHMVTYIGNQSERIAKHLNN